MTTTRKTERGHVVRIYRTRPNKAGGFVIDTISAFYEAGKRGPVRVLKT